MKKESLEDSTIELYPGVRTVSLKNKSKINKKNYITLSNIVFLIYKLKED